MAHASSFVLSCWTRYCFAGHVFFLPVHVVKALVPPLYSWSGQFGHALSAPAEDDSNNSLPGPHETVFGVHAVAVFVPALNLPMVHPLHTLLLVADPDAV